MGFAISLKLRLLHRETKGDATADNKPHLTDSQAACRAEDRTQLVLICSLKSGDLLKTSGNVTLLSL